MLKIKKLELLGFKSFADRTRLEFPDGTVAVVGPNGCGKSNLSDAINWVLGEQSARLLRGERMTDVIFNGTGMRPPTGMAEVSLTLEDPDYDAASNGTDKENHQEELLADAEEGAQEPLEQAAPKKVNGSSHKTHLKDGSGQITVTRRLFRSGESEYLINGRSSRLRDIQDLFMGTGLGPESYAIIEQGRIGQILSSKPSDRRLILEEAAGISKFKTRKRAAELKLESSRANLSRITDILDEVTKQVNSLKRQASKARRFRELHEEMMGHQKVVLASRLKTLETHCHGLREEFEKLQNQCSEASQQFEQLDQDQNSARTQCEELESQLGALREASTENEIERQRLQSRREQIQQQIASLDARCADAGQESERIRARTESLEQESALRSGEHAQLLEEQTIAQEAGAKLLEEQKNLGVQIRNAEHTVERSRQAQLAAISRAANFRNQLVQAEEVVLALDRQAVRIQSERSGVEAERQRLAAELEGLTSENGRVQTSLAQLANSVSATAAALQEAQSVQTTQRKDLENLRRELSGMVARKQALEESLARHAYSTESVRRLLNGEIRSTGRPFRPLGVLADYLEVTPGYEEIVEEFLNPELDCVVVEEHTEARSGIELLEAEGTGRSTFFVTRAPSSGYSNGNGDQQVQQEPGVIAPLRDMVRFESRLGLNGEPPLPALGKAYLVKDTTTAEELAARYPEFHFLTPSGGHYHHRLVSGGRGASAGPLALRRDFRELERSTTRLESDIQEREATLSKVEEHASKLKAELDQLSAVKLSSEKDFAVSSERLRQAQESSSRILERLRMFEEESRKIEEERQGLQARRASLQTQMEAEETEKSRLEVEVARNSEGISESRLQFDQVAQALARAQAQFSSLQERTRAMESERTRLAAQIQEMTERVTHLTLQIEKWSEEQRQLAQDAEAAQEQHSMLEAKHTELKNRLQSLTGQLQAVRIRRDELRPLVEAARAQYDEHREKRAEVEVALARAESDRDHYAQQCREALQIEPETLLAGLAEDAVVTGEALEAAEEQLRELKKRIDNLGPLNMMALEELKEAEERYEFLEAQRQDLLTSIEDTTQAIREIDRVSRQQFLEAFKIINENFAESFRTLFGGGIGHLRLSDEEDPESGLDIVAQPPGKRLQNILLLSGGEKALAALALLIAIFRYTPSPFCVLDEVDAPLDDTNVDRFTRLIHQMSRTTQFILMTHNKHTMEIAGAIYGVTMADPGVSSLVSVKFDEAPAELAAVPA